MSDLKDEIAEKIRPFVRGNSVKMNLKHAFEATDVAIETIIARIPPLVWKTEGRTVFSAKGYVVIKDDLSGLYRFRPDGEKLSAGYDSEQAAKAAANAHHVAQLCKGMGIE